MLILLLVILLILLSASVTFNVLLLRAGERQLKMNEMYSGWISNWRKLILKTHIHMRLLDEKQMFEKDDEVGIIFQDMKELVEDLNDKTEEIVEGE